MLGNASVNAALSKTPLTVLTCPSDNGNPYYNSARQYYSVSTTITGGYRSSYDFSGNYEEYYCDHYWQVVLTPSTRPLFGNDSNSKIRDITDGIANTAAMIGEQCREGSITAPWAGHIVAA